MAILEWDHNHIISIFHIVIVVQTVVEGEIIIVIIVINSVLEYVGKLKLVRTLGPVVEVLEKDVRA